MSELSPHAQEVFWAFNRVASGKPDEWHYLPAIAAAIREIAAKYSYEVHGDRWYELVVDTSDLLALAYELEAFAQ